MTRKKVAGSACSCGNGSVMDATPPARSCQQTPQEEMDAAYSTFSLTTKPLCIARSKTKDIYRCRVMSDFAARASRRFTALAVRRIVTGLAVSDLAVMACEQALREDAILTGLPLGCHAQGRGT